MTSTGILSHGRAPTLLTTFPLQRLWSPAATSICILRVLSTLCYPVFSPSKTKSTLIPMLLLRGNAYQVPGLCGWLSCSRLRAATVFPCSRMALRFNTDSTAFEKKGGMRGLWLCLRTFAPTYATNGRQWGGCGFTCGLP